MVVWSYHWCQETQRSARRMDSPPLTARRRLKRSAPRQKHLISAEMRITPIAHHLDQTRATLTPRHLDRSRAVSSHGAAERPLYFVFALAVAVAVAVAVALVLAVALAVALASGYAKASALALYPRHKKQGLQPLGDASRTSFNCTSSRRKRTDPCISLLQHPSFESTMSLCIQQF